MNIDELNDENAALVTLLNTCQKPDTWLTLTNECLLEGSAVRVLQHKISPADHGLHIDESFTTREHDQGVLLGADEIAPTGDRITQLEHGWRDARRRIAAWNRQGLRFVSIFDTEFPTRLRAIADVPPFVFSRGSLKRDDMAVSVVGSRACTAQSAEFARDTVRMLVNYGFTVIAGLAQGVDSVAHHEALRLGGRTVAFIGTGINRYYPIENRPLQEEIERRGLVLSQFWPDTAPTRHTFPMRNALMSGYGLATVVVQANEYSGTRVQARQAQHHGRPLILRDTVLQETTWARKYAGKPGVYVVHSVDDVDAALKQIQTVDTGVETLLDQILNTERQSA